MAGMMLILWASGCASSAAALPTSRAQPTGIFVEQVPVTDYMRSQVGTPNELSPLAPPQARNIRKVGNQWLCEMNGQSLIFNGATSCWEPQPK